MNIKTLTDEQIETLLWKHDDLYDFARAIEKAVLKSSKVQGLLNALQEVVDAADAMLRYQNRRLRMEAQMYLPSYMREVAQSGNLNHNSTRKLC